MPRPLICVTLSGCTVDEMLKDAAMATAAGADMVEVRLDKLWVVEQMPEEEPVREEAEGESRRPKYVEPEIIPQPLDSVDVQGALEFLKQGIDLPVVLTCRPERQQGHYPGEEEQRIKVLSAAIKSGVSWIDIEVDIESKKRKSLMDDASGTTKVVASYHSSESPPSASEIIQDVEDSSDDGDIIKICYRSSRPASVRGRVGPQGIGSQLRHHGLGMGRGLDQNPRPAARAGSGVHHHGQGPAPLEAGQNQCL